eukprot:978721-Pyramimonas_sp.AAC.1
MAPIGALRRKGRPLEPNGHVSLGSPAQEEDACSRNIGDHASGASAIPQQPRSPAPRRVSNEQAGGNPSRTASSSAPPSARPTSAKTSLPEVPA